MLRENDFDLETLERHIKGDEVDALWEELGLSVKQKIQFRKLMDIVDEIENEGDGDGDVAKPQEGAGVTTCAEATTTAAEDRTPKSDHILMTTQTMHFTRK